MPRSAPSPRPARRWWPSIGGAVGHPRGTRGRARYRRRRSCRVRGQEQATAASERGPSLPDWP
eukprot:858541-Alexandrium_andersonii.AAC.1